MYIVPTTLQYIRTYTHAPTHVPVSEWYLCYSCEPLLALVNVKLGPVDEVLVDLPQSSLVIPWQLHSLPQLCRSVCPLNCLHVQVDDACNRWGEERKEELNWVCSYREVMYIHSFPHSCRLLPLPPLAHYPPHTPSSTHHRVPWLLHICCLLVDKTVCCTVQ